MKKLALYEVTLCNAKQSIMILAFSCDHAIAIAVECQFAVSSKEISVDVLSTDFVTECEEIAKHITIEPGVVSYSHHINI